MEQRQVEELIEIAVKQLEYAYATYSGFKVGAALLTAEGKCYTGCNIENAAYTPTNCAEEQHFSRQSVKGNESFRQFALLVGKMVC